MTAKFGFQVTVNDRAIWIFPEDIDAATVAAQAEAELRQRLAVELGKKVFDTQTKIDNFVAALNDGVLKSQIEGAINALPQTEGKAKVSDQVAIIVSKVSLDDIESKISELSESIKSSVNGLKAKASSGVVYAWTRAPGEDPISLGVFRDLTLFIDNKIIGSLPRAVRPNFNVTESFGSLVNGLPDPVSGAVESLTTKAVFELDGIRLKIPGKGSAETTQFEIAMLINLMPLNLTLGPFQANRLYAKLGNFVDSVASTSGT